MFWINQQAVGCVMKKYIQEQLLSFARLFYRRPYFAALDEATSALPVQMEERLYQYAISDEIS